jgi:hypothetical protein
VPIIIAQQSIGTLAKDTLILQTHHKKHDIICPFVFTICPKKPRPITEDTSAKQVDNYKVFV